MDDKKAITILLGLLEKNLLDSAEKEAIRVAIGILGWTSLSKNRIKALVKAKKDKQEKSARW